jgi:hypothetical protein
VTASSSPSVVLSSWLVLSYWYDVVPATDSSAKAQGQGQGEVEVEVEVIISAGQRDDLRSEGNGRVAAGVQEPG